MLIAITSPDKRLVVDAELTEDEFEPGLWADMSHDDLQSLWDFGGEVDIIRQLLQVVYLHGDGVTIDHDGLTYSVAQSLGAPPIWAGHAFDSECGYTAGFAA